MTLDENEKHKNIIDDIQVQTMKQKGWWMPKEKMELKEEDGRGTLLNP